MPAGRPEINLDWNQIDHLLAAGCTGKDVAGRLGIHEHTLYNQVKSKFGLNFSDYCASRYSKGDSLIKEVRFNKAIKGNVQLLLYLSEVRLKEKKDDPSNISVEDLEKYQKIMSMLEEMQSHSSERKIDDNSIINEQKS